MNILLIEDSTSQAMVIARKMRLASHDVTICGSVESAADVMTSDQWDAAVIDWHLPDSTGRELFALADARNIPAVAYTAYEILSDIGATVISKLEPCKLIEWLEDVERKKDE